MFFHFGTDETVLFESWKFTSVAGLIGSMIGIFILAVLYEGLKYYRFDLVFIPIFPYKIFQTVTKK